MMKKHAYKAAPPTVRPPAHVAPAERLHQCPSCTRRVPLLVEGSDLCMKCDHLHFPELVVA